MGKLIDAEMNARRDRNVKILNKATKKDNIKFDFKKINNPGNKKLKYSVNKTGLFGVGKY